LIIDLVKGLRLDSGRNAMREEFNLNDLAQFPLSFVLGLGNELQNKGLIKQAKKNQPMAGFKKTREQKLVF
jgi:hypothetical protein